MTWRLKMDLLEESELLNSGSRGGYLLIMIAVGRLRLLISQRLFVYHMCVSIVSMNT